MSRKRGRRVLPGLYIRSVQYRTVPSVSMTICDCADLLEDPCTDEKLAYANGRPFKVT